MKIRRYEEELDEEDIPKSVAKMKKKNQTSKNKHMAEEPKKRKSPTRNNTSKIQNKNQKTKAK